MRRMVKRGEAIELARRVDKTGTIVIVFRRLKPAAPRWHGLARAAGIALGALLLASAGLWWVAWTAWTLLRQIAPGIPALVALAAVWWLVTRLAHSGGCLGLHCSGCRE
jgi:hypothetical protein